MMKKELKAKNSFIDKLNQFNLGRCAACGKFKLRSLFVRSERSQMPTAPYFIITKLKCELCGTENVKREKLSYFLGFLSFLPFFIAAFDFFIAGERGLALNNNVDFIEVVPLGLSVLFILIANFFFNLFINTNKVLLDASINDIPFVERKGMQRNQFIFSAIIMVLLGLYWLNLNIRLIPQLAVYLDMMPFISIFFLLFFFLTFFARIKNKAN